MDLSLRPSQQDDIQRDEPQFKSDGPGLCWVCHGIDLSLIGKNPGFKRQDSFWRYGGFMNETLPKCILCNILFCLIANCDSSEKIPRRMWRARIDARNPCCTLLTIDGYQITIHPRRLLAPPERTTANLAGAKLCLEHCRSKHGTTCHNPPSQNTTHIRLIDCVTNQLCSATVDECYVCLSYVWGSESAQQDLGSKSLLNAPKTIRDAMFVVLQLGLRYLWVDRYCIDQSDTPGKQYAIANMGSVYQRAELVVIAAAGDGPEHGLPGVQGTARTLQPRLRELNQYLRQHIAIGPEDNLVAIDDPSVEILNSKWNSRGWTYQEMLLPQRLLVFTESEVRFECKDRVCQDALDAICNYAQVYSKHRIFSRRVGVRPRSLFTRLQEFYPRTLSLQADYIKAIVGIFSTWNGDKRLTQFYGLPCYADVCNERTATSLFTAGLLWHVTGETAIDRPSIIDHGFPSWAWASVKCARTPTQPGHIFFMGWAYRCCLDINVQVFNSLGFKLDMKTCLDSIWDYEQFQPKIEITSRVANWDIKSPPLNQNQYLDYKNTLPSGQCIAINLCEKHVCLLLAENVKEGIYRRIGIACKSLDERNAEKASLETIEAVRKWELRTIQLV